ncbi:hypothetical protein ACFQDD_00460 [Halorubrum pallidum]|uniref:C2H2-type domain-containing protein n=1 Tax=Halorubrum pallidum TaxID=1526114 RepID=A0ABD5SXQ7_9EURY
MVEKFGKCTACGYIADDFQDAKEHSRREHGGNRMPGFGGYESYDPGAEAQSSAEEEGEVA